MDIGKYYRVAGVPDDVDSFHAGWDWRGGFSCGATGSGHRWASAYVEECEADVPGAFLCEMGTAIVWRRHAGMSTAHEWVGIASDVGRSLPSPQRHAICFLCGWEGPTRDSEDEAWPDAARHRDDPRLYGGDRVVLPGLYREETSGEERRYGSGGVFKGEDTIWKFVSR